MDHVLKGTSYLCCWKDCEYDTPNCRLLKGHLPIHTEKQPYKCEHEGCSKAFAQKNNLTSHQRTHTGERPFKCKHKSCDKAFAQRNDLIKHQRIHTGEQPYKCQHCGANFADSGNRTKHQRSQHPNAPNTADHDNNAPPPTALSLRMPRWKKILPLQHLLF